MKKLLLTILLSISFITTQINAKEIEKTEDELVAEFLKMDKEIEDMKAKTKALENLENTVDKLTNTLGIKDK